MYTIRKQFSCSSGHYLLGLSKEHPCGNFHGHNYTFTFEFKADYLDNVGFVLDYREMQSIKDFIDQSLDHKDLNTVLSFNPTSENIAKFLFQAFKKEYPILSAVEVSETPKTMARFEI